MGSWKTWRWPTAQNGVNKILSKSDKAVSNTMDVKLEGDGVGGFNTSSRGSAKEFRRPQDDTERGQRWRRDVVRRRAPNLAATIARARAMLRRENKSVDES